MLARLKINGHAKIQKCKKTLIYLPNVITFLNAIFGFLSIIGVFEGNYFFSAFFIVLAALMDLLDGRLARVFGFTSCFGLQLDSLCDAVSFCLAPTILLYSWASDNFNNISYIFVFGLVAYLCCGLGRLAKFNISAEKQHNMFIGLPTPVAAIFVSSLIFYHNWLNAHYVSILFDKNIITLLVGSIAFLMISNLRFFTFKNFGIKKDYLKFVLFVISMIWALLHGYPILFFLVSGYIITGIAGSLMAKVNSKFYN